MTEQLDLVLFDLDGTLYYSTDLLPIAYQRGIEAFQQQTDAGITVPDRDEITEQVGNPVEEIYANLFPDLTPEQARELSHYILDELTELIRDGGGNLVESVPDVLERLQEIFPLGIVTNARRPYLEAVAETYDLETWFERMLCLSDVEGQKKSLMVESQLEYFSAEPSKTLLIGDRSSDREAAKETGIDFVGCNFGYGNSTEFGSAYVIERFNELLEHPRLKAVTGA